MEWKGIEIKIQSTVDEGELVILVTTHKNQKVPAALVVEAGFLWNRQGQITISNSILTERIYRMIYRNVELFNVCEAENREREVVLRMHRFPGQVREKLGWGKNSFGRYVAQMTTGCEIRFVTEGDTAAVTLCAMDEDGEVLVYQGDFLHSRHRLQQGVAACIRFSQNSMMGRLREEIFEGGRFSHRVWRILFCHDFICGFAGLEDYGYDIRPPAAGETPSIKWMAYGSSITHGACAQLHTNSYIMQAARRLGVDVLNKGMGGSCLCEREIADYLAENGEWDLLTLELGVNMRGGFTPEEFEEHAGYLVDAVKTRNPGKPVVLVTIFPNFSGCFKEEANETNWDIPYNKIIRKLHTKYSDGYTHLIEGSDILTDFSWLACDYIHPSEHGHVMMGQKLAERMEAIIL